MLKNHVIIKQPMRCDDAIQLILSQGVRNIIILSQDDELIGLLSMGDILRSKLKQPFNNLEIDKIANYNPIVADEHTSINDLLAIMKKNNIVVVPIVRGKKVIAVKEIFECL